MTINWKLRLKNKVTLTALVTMIVAIIAGGAAVLSNLLIAWGSNSKTLYRIDQLEKKMEKHNNLVESVTLCEADDESQWKRIDELRQKVELLEATK